MSRKILPKFQIVTSGDMSQATVTSTVTNIERLDNIGVQLNWTGSPVGTFAVQVSIDYEQDDQGNVLDAGNWVTIVTASTAAGSPIMVNLTALSAPWIRTVYTRSSASGTLNAFISGKAAA